MTACHVPSDLAETAELLLSELVTNAVRHGRVPRGREIGVRSALSGGELRVEVADVSDSQPQMRESGDGDERGRGLLLVDSLADKWGVSRRGVIGKTVWFVLALPSEPAC
ncbi:hypothetical protein ACZ90_61215 [Streptomyces albus subsp. albus]|nr:hypothetical protein ACZ90_61215 [Streptomyces albus subsp. albus]